MPGAVGAVGAVGAMGTRAPRAFGENLGWCEGPDLICLRLVGRLEFDHFRGILESCVEWHNEMPGCAVLVDLRDLTAVSSSARSIAMSVRQGGISAPCACFGASFAVQIFADMMVRARRLLGGHSRSAVRFFRTEEEARSYIAARPTAAA